VSEGAALVLRDVRRAFGETVALDGAHCAVRRGTVHALLGENGAGKTTLMRIAFGLLRPDAGQVLVEGRPMRFRSSADAIASGIGMVHQHFMLVPALTVAENVALGGQGRFDAQATAERVREIGRDTGLLVDPGARVHDLAVGAQQRLEIVKALAHDARILILDEPTAVLAPAESDDLLRWLRRFAAGGGTAVLITHKLREALAVADDVTVLRRGRTVLTGARASLDEAAVISALVGEEPDSAARIERPVRPARAAPAARDDAEPVLALHDVGFVDARGVIRLDGVSLAVHAGEVVGVLGVEGAGQRELLRILAGRLAPTRGRVTRPERVGFIPEDRLHDALIPSLTLTENLALADAGRLRGLLRWREITERTATLLSRSDVRVRGPATRASALSGGNQQKFVVGRERALASRALVAENPTRGLDLRAAAQVREEIGAPDAGAAPAVVFYSADIDEVLAVSDRVVVCFAGRLHEVERPADPTDRTPYARAMTGATT
jgi:simple sugar transport system ATP-binding protein